VQTHLGRQVVGHGKNVCRRLPTTRGRFDGKLPVILLPGHGVQARLPPVSAGGQLCCRRQYPIIGRCEVPSSKGLHGGNLRERGRGKVLRANRQNNSFP
jgi:hypothetical protein